MTPMETMTAGATRASFTEATEAAMRRALTVGVVGAGVLAALVAVVVALVVSLLAAVLVGVVVAVAAALIWLRWVRAAFDAADEVLTHSLGRAATEAEVPSLHNALQGVAILTGVQVPEIRLVDTDAANAMVATGSEGSTVVVTTGLLEGLRTVESEVVAAELLCRVRDGSARLATVVAGVPPLVARAGGLDQAVLARTLGEQRALRADAEALAVTRYPPGLVSVLERMAAAGTNIEGAPAAGAALWIAPAVGTRDGVHEAVDRTVNQDLEYRIAVLREL